MRKMNDSDPKLIALLYNECINNQDLNGLILMMSDDHKFIDTKNKVETRDKMEEGWKTFFELYPDYKNIFHTVISRDNFVIMLGHSECSYEPLDGPAIWTAKIVNGKVAEWRIYDDTEDNRVLLLITK